MAKCFDVVGYVEPCNAVRRKYTGRALLILGATNDSGVVFTFSDNGLKVTEIGGKNSLLEAELNSFVVSINAENPFGVTVQGNTDSGRVSYTKTIPVSIPATRDGKSEEFIMGLQKGIHIDGAIVLETFADSDDNDIFGAYSPIRLDPASVTRNEYENGGAWNFNLVCEEPVPNVICTMIGLSTTIQHSLTPLNA